MKRYLLILILALVAIQSNAQFTKATLQATGLTCAMCSNAINKALLKLPFIESVKSNIKNSTFSIIFKEGLDLNIDGLKKAVEDAGFAVGGLKLTGTFTDLKIAADTHIKIGNAYFHFIGVTSQTLNGENTLSVLDKNFITAKQFKKISSANKMPCIESGTAGDCCAKDSIAPGTRVYHVTI